MHFTAGGLGPKLLRNGQPVARYNFLRVAFAEHTALAHPPDFVHNIQQKLQFMRHQQYCCTGLALLFYLIQRLTTHHGIFQCEGVKNGNRFRLLNFQIISRTQ